MRSLVQPNAWVCLRLPSDTLKVLQIVPNTIVSLGKYGTFSSNLIISRPYNLTYELLDREPGEKDSRLRIVPASELHADTLAEEKAAANPKSPDEKITIGGDGVEFQLVGENGEVIMRSNRETIDDAARQTMTMDEIEELKREGTGAGKDLIAKLMASHLGIEQKTKFSLAKYKLLKTKKYLKRFTILPIDVPMLTEWMMEEKDAGKILEIRQEMLALIGSWANVHFSEEPVGETLAVPDGSIAQEISMLLAAEASTVSSSTATLVEPSIGSETTHSTTAPEPSITEPSTLTSSPIKLDPSPTTASPTTTPSTISPSIIVAPLALSPNSTPGGRYLVIDEAGGLIVSTLAERMGILYPPPSPTTDSPTTAKPHPIDPPLARTNTITLIHQNAQPNLTLLKHFSHDPLLPSSTPNHPLSTHLHTISWLQLLHPHLDTTCSTPIPILSPSELLAMRSGKRGTYYKKLRRSNRVREIVQNTRRGGFSSLIVASTMDPISILRPLLPLLRGGAQIAIYSPTIEPLLLLQDAFSTSRRTAYIQSPPPPLSDPSSESTESSTEFQGNEDFPLNPTLVINTSVQTARIREWQVLPGRTHPIMTGKGGAEGYLWTGTRVFPAKGGRVEARGKWGRKRVAEGGKVEVDGDTVMSETGEGMVEDAPSPSKKRKVEVEGVADS